MSDSEERLQAVEEKMAYFEKAIADLDGVVRSLSAQVDTVLVQMKRLVQIERSLSQGEAPPDEPPPHY